MGSKRYKLQYTTHSNTFYKPSLFTSVPQVLLLGTVAPVPIFCLLKYSSIRKLYFSATCQHLSFITQRVSGPFLGSVINPSGLLQFLTPTMSPTGTVVLQGRILAPDKKKEEKGLYKLPFEYSFLSCTNTHWHRHLYTTVIGYMAVMANL